MCMQHVSSNQNTFMQETTSIGLQTKQSLKKLIENDHLQIVQFLCNGLEDDVYAKQLGWGQQPDNDTELRNLISNSGKMVLLFKLLPKLRAEGRKVPIHMPKSLPFHRITVLV